MGASPLSAPYRPAMGGGRIAADVRPFCALCTSVIKGHMKGPASGGTDGASTGGRLRDFCLISGDGANGTKYDMGLSKRKIKLDRQLEFDEEWRVHDLRRTCRSGLSRLEVGREIAEYVIGHTATGLVRVYNKYELLPERRDALQRWADWVREVVGPSEPGKVVIGARRQLAS